MCVAAGRAEDCTRHQCDMRADVNGTRCQCDIADHDGDGTRQPCDATGSDDSGTRHLGEATGRSNDGNKHQEEAADHDDNGTLATSIDEPPTTEPRADSRTPLYTRTYRD